MSKPDFFLPFHLPMVVEENSFLNFYVMEYLQKAKGCVSDYYREHGMNDRMREVKKGIIIARLQNGCYQTIITTKEKSFFVATFSISLN